MTAVEYKHDEPGHLDMKLGGNLSIEVSGYGGSDVYEMMQDMLTLANKLGVDIWANINNVRTLARPGDDYESLKEDWDRASARAFVHGRQYASAK